ncbi:MAG: hypothetical protein H7231_02385, partial [Rhodoferax sp.]|nr:hypothetical protein [Actinomycetota bacterium]
MSRATSARRRFLVGGALGALAILIAAPAYADTTPTPNISATTPTGSPSAVPTASPSSTTAATPSPTTTPVVPGPTLRVVAA